jgi:hypothetical protein
MWSSIITACLPRREGRGPVPDPFLLSANEEIGLGEALRQIVRRFCVVGAAAALAAATLFLSAGEVMGTKKPIRRIVGSCGAGRCGVVADVHLL